MGFDRNAGLFGGAVGAASYLLTLGLKAIAPNVFTTQSLQQLAPSQVAGAVGTQIFGAINVGTFDLMALIIFAAGGAVLMAVASWAAENWISQMWKPTTVFQRTLVLVMLATFVGSAWLARGQIADMFTLSAFWNLLLSSLVVAAVVSWLVTRRQFFNLNVPWS